MSSLQSPGPGQRWDQLRYHPWPGNIRELQNAIERSLITSEGTLVTAAYLAILPVPAAPPPAPIPLSASAVETTPSVKGSGSLEDRERAAILDALQRTQGHKTLAAELLGFTRFQLHTRLKRYGVEVSPDWKASFRKTL